MKLGKTIMTTIFVGFFLVHNIYAQVNVGGEPYSFKHSLPKSVEIINMEPINIEELRNEDKAMPEDVPYRFGYGFDVKYDLDNSGNWIVLDDGSKVWRLQIKSEGAYSINLIYDNFWLPRGAKLYIYSADKSMMIGAFTSRNNKPHGKFATGLVRGDEIVLEYYEPSNVAQKGKISISRIVHAYKNLFNISESQLKKTSEFGDSESCNNNVLILGTLNFISCAYRFKLLISNISIYCAHYSGVPP